MKWIDDVMGKLEFFNQNPELRHSVLEKFSKRYFRRLFKLSPNVTQSSIYESIKQEFGNDFGENDVLIPALCTFVNTQQKKIDSLKKQLKTM